MTCYTPQVHLNITLKVLACSGLVALLLAATAAHAGDVEDATGATDLRAWQTEGAARDGDEWRAMVLEIRGDVGILRTLVLRLEERGLSTEEARWFEAPAGLQPVDLHTRTLTFADEELATIREWLTGPEIDAFREQTRRRCFVTTGESEIRIVASFQVTSPDDEAARTDRRVGMSFDERGTEPACESVDSVADVIEKQLPSEPSGGSIDKVAALLDDLEHHDAPIETELAALPTARTVRSLLAESDESQIPDALPSELVLALFVAPPGYGEALALERMLNGGAEEQQVALWELRRFATPNAVPLLRSKLRDSLGEEGSVTPSVALLALLAADPAAARREATLLLINHPRRVRQALGVFALTDPDLAQDLEALEVEDDSALAGAAARVIEHLEATADDDIVEVIRARRRAISP